MSVSMFRAVFALTSGLVLATSGTATAQWFPTFNNCCPPQPVAQYCPQPVAQTVYRTVPVTEYRQVRRTVKRPIVETKYVEQPATEYRPVVETKTAEIPTVEYHNVVEYQTRQCNAGYWTTRYSPIPRVSPCEYDNRPDLLGFLNRTGYSLRMALTPSVIPMRQYVPQTVVQTIPVTRRIAISNTKKVTYNVTRLVPYTTTRRVAVKTVKYVDENVVALEPVTVMRTMPIGTRTAFGYNPYVLGTTQTALQPSPDPISSSAGSKTSPKRTADSQSKYDGGDAVVPREAQPSESNNRNRVPATRSSLTAPLRRSSAEPVYLDRQRVDARELPSARRTPSIVRVSGWRARHPSSGGSPLSASPVSVADNSP